MGSLSMSPWISMRPPTASLALTSSSSSSSLIPASSSSSVSLLNTRSPLLRCSFLSSPSSLSFPSSSLSGLSLGLDLISNAGTGNGKRRGLVVRAGKKFALCQTKRNRSRKSLARTHGFRRRMRTTGGRAILRRRRAKGRKVLCTKTHPNSGK